MIHVIGPIGAHRQNARVHVGEVFQPKHVPADMESK